MGGGALQSSRTRPAPRRHPGTLCTLPRTARAVLSCARLVLCQGGAICTVCSCLLAVAVACAPTHDLAPPGGHACVVPWRVACARARARRRLSLLLAAAVCFRDRPVAVAVSRNCTDLGGCLCLLALCGAYHSADLAAVARVTRPYISTVPSLLVMLPSLFSTSAVCVCVCEYIQSTCSFRTHQPARCRHSSLCCRLCSARLPSASASASIFNQPVPFVHTSQHGAVTPRYAAVFVQHVCVCVCVGVCVLICECLQTTYSFCTHHSLLCCRLCSACLRRRLRLRLRISSNNLYPFVHISTLPSLLVMLPSVFSPSPLAISTLPSRLVHQCNQPTRV